MDERAKNKRKLREMEQEDEDDDDEVDVSFAGLDGVEIEKPGEGLKKKTTEPNKKQKRDEGNNAEDDWEDEEEELTKDSEAATEDQEPQVKLSKKQEKKAAKMQKRKEKKAEKKAKKGDQQDSPEKSEAARPVEDAPTPAKTGKKSKKETAPPKDTDAEVVDEGDDDELVVSKDHGVAFSGMQQDEEGSGPSVAESEPQSPTFDANAPNGTAADAASASTSVSSTVPPSEKPKHIKIPTDTSHLKARLAAKIEALRAARKADGPDGKPIRTRQELIESRRFKEAQRKAHKKELRQQAKLEEEKKREEALASNSPSVMSPGVERADSPGNFAFGRVAFGDGTQLSHDLSYVLNNGKKKGPSDPKTALLKVQAQKKRMQELDEEKRKDIAEKEAWLTARRRVEGEKIRDDEAILKKSVKRMEAGKRKSEKAWKDRQKGVAHAQKEKQLSLIHI